MKLICVKDSNNNIIADKTATASTFFQRARGLLFSDPLMEGAGLWIKPCSSVHTFFMTYSIDVIFLDKDMVIVNITADMPPWRISKIVKKAESVLELPAGTVRRSNLSLGEQLVFRALPD